MLTPCLSTTSQKRPGVGIIGDALKHQRDRAIGERAVDNIGVARDPPNVSRAPVDLATIVIEDILVGHGGVDHVAAGGVQHTLGLTGRARGVENEQAGPPRSFPRAHTSCPEDSVMT